ncbi:MAG TPA: hypothetical protein PLC48_00400 [Ferruginibacter sp.]|nr:hypothetical protein [Ferruginibacter sp.]
MRKFYFLLVMTACSLSVEAQYKKASFLTRGGRTYDLGFSGHFISDGKSNVPGIYYSYGSDKGKRFFQWNDLELLLPTKFEYQTRDVNLLTPVTVTGKSKLGLAFRYNVGFYLLNPKNEKNKLKPFLTIGLNVLALGGSAKPVSVEYNPDLTNGVEKYPGETTFSFGGNVGAGAIFTLSDKFGIKLAGGYNLQSQVEPSKYDDSYDSFNVYGSHPYVNLGVRFTMMGN